MSTALATDHSCFVRPLTFSFSLSWLSYCCASAAVVGPTTASPPHLHSPQRQSGPLPPAHSPPSSPPTPPNPTPLKRVSSVNLVKPAFRLQQWTERPFIQATTSQPTRQRSCAVPAPAPLCLSAERVQVWESAQLLPVRVWRMGDRACGRQVSSCLEYEMRIRRRPISGSRRAQRFRCCGHTRLHYLTSWS